MHAMKNLLDLTFEQKYIEKNIYKKGLRQCAKLHDFGEVVVVVPGQEQSPILLCRLRTQKMELC